MNKDIIELIAISAVLLPFFGGVAVILIMRDFGLGLTLMMVSVAILLFIDKVLKI